MDVIELLIEEHRTMDRLLDCLDVEDRPEPLHEAFARLVEILVAHEAIEQEVLFPAFRAARPEAVSDAGHLQDEHDEMNQLLAEMRELSATGAGFLKRACALVFELREHFAEEEEDLFPQMRQALGADELEELAVRALETRERVAAALT